MKPQPIPTQYKDPSAILDFALDLAPAAGINTTPYLADGETVTSLTVTADTGLTVSSSAVAANSRGIPSSLLVAWLSGGTAGVTYNVRFVFSTSQGRTDARTLPAQVIAR
jgi:hypothetical protein